MVKLTVQTCVTFGIEINYKNIIDMLFVRQSAALTQPPAPHSSNKYIPKYALFG